MRRCLEVRDVSAAYRVIHDEWHDLLESDVVETGNQGEEDLSAGKVEVREMTGSRIRVETVTPGPARLVLPRAPFPFRRVTVDGRPATADPTDLCLISVRVPPGRHVVRLDEELPGGALGPSLSGCGVLAVVLLISRKRA